MQTSKIANPGGRLRLLDPHASIAWDFDHTLIDNPHIQFFHKYIRQTPHKRHMIVTFRTNNIQYAMFDELAAYPDAPTADDFAGFLNIGDAAWAKWNADASMRGLGLLTGPPTPAELYFVTWKGMICRKRGLTVLVDDDIGNTVPGCRKHGIRLFNSITLASVE